MLNTSLTWLLEESVVPNILSYQTATLLVVHKLISRISLYDIVMSIFCGKSLLTTWFLLHNDALYCFLKHKKQTWTAWLLFLIIKCFERAEDYFLLSKRCEWLVKNMVLL